MCKKLKLILIGTLYLDRCYNICPAICPEHCYTMNRVFAIPKHVACHLTKVVKQSLPDLLQLKCTTCNFLGDDTGIDESCVAHNVLVVL